MTDRELLDQITRDRSETAFTELVRRHIDLVHSAALRQLGDADTARDITQSVFILLARQAGKLPAEVVLSGWLYRATRNLCLETLRRDRRRREREQAVGEQLMNDATANPWEQVAPALEPAMDELGETDRQAVLLRYFENRSLREVGAALGLGEDAAQKRVSRALDRLRDIFTRRGVSLSATALAGSLSAGAVQAAPAGLAVTISSAVLGGTAIATAITLNTATIMSLFNLKTAAAILGAAAVTGTTTYLVQEREVDRLRADYQTLNGTHAKLADEQREALAMVQLRDEQVERLRRDVADLPRLRGEVDQLRRQTNELAEIRRQGESLRQENAKLREQPTSEILEPTEPAPTPWKYREPRRLSEMKDVGRATPEAAMESILWAAANRQFGKITEMVHLPEGFLENARQEGRLSLVTAQLGFEAYTKAKLTAELSGEADGQVWLENSSGTLDSSVRSLLRMTGPDGKTYEYDNVVDFHLTGSPEPSNPAAARFNDFSFIETEDGWKQVIPGISPENPRRTD